MFKKINILAKAMELGAFDVAQLALACEANPVTVQTILSRSPPGWFTQERIPTGSRGGQPVRYSLTEVGRQGIAEDLRKLPVVPAYQLRERPPGSAPIGLKVAQQELTKISAMDPEADIGKWLKRISQNLDWADTELMHSPASVENAKYRVQLEVARSQAAERELLAELTSTRVLPAAAFAEPFAHPVASARVWIGQLGDDDGVWQMTLCAKMAVKSAAYVAQRAGVTNSVRLEVINLGIRPEDEIDRLKTLLPAADQSSAEVLVCMNSDINRELLMRSLQALAPTFKSCSAWLLDYSESHEVARYAKSCRVTYRPHAEQDLSWLDSTFLWRS
jgi:hypothetical protein